VKDGTSPVPKVVKKTTQPVVGTPMEAAPTPSTTDPMAVALKLALGKTEAQFRTAIAIDPQFANSPLLPMAKAGVISQALVNEGKLVIVGGKYQIPE